LGRGIEKSARQAKRCHDIRERWLRRGLPTAPLAVLPSAWIDSVGTPKKVISQLDGWPACAPVQRFAGGLMVFSGTRSQSAVASPLAALIAWLAAAEVGP